MLPGFRSRWITPASWAWCRASAILAHNSAASRTENRWAVSRSASVTPSTKSLTMKTVSRSRPTSWTLTMFGCRSWAAALASRRNCSVSSGSSCPLRGILIATVRSSSVSRAFHTNPNVPTPIFSTRSKWPIVFVPAS